MRGTLSMAEKEEAFRIIRTASKDGILQLTDQEAPKDGIGDIEVKIPSGMKNGMNSDGEMVLYNAGRSLVISLSEAAFTNPDSVQGDICDAIMAADGQDYAACTTNAWKGISWSGVVYQGGAKAFKGSMGRFYSLEPNEGKTFVLISILDDSGKFDLRGFIEKNITMKWTVPKEAGEDE
jgi:hypothetical protein